MSVFIGSVNGPHHNSPDAAAAVWCSPSQVELVMAQTGSDGITVTCRRNFDPIAARNLAALLVRASEEADRMAARLAPHESTSEGA